MMNRKRLLMLLCLLLCLLLTGCYTEKDPWPASGVSAAPKQETPTVVPIAPVESAAPEQDEAPAAVPEATPTATPGLNG